MPRIDNPKHELFAQELAKGKSQAEAYELAGYKGDRTAASRLSTNSNVQARVAEIQQRSAVKAEMTIATISEMLLADRALARELGQPGAAVSADEKLAKLHGLMVDRKHHSGDPELMPFVRIERVIVSPNRPEAAEDPRSAQALTDRNRRYNN
jgi:phage terminase small subunit